jgi:diguanylate cyclase (GGDEF)-like protein/PAS domain S-box-containing protein
MRRERDEKRAFARKQRRLAEINSAILSSMPAHVALLDADGHIVAVNQAWQYHGTRYGFDDPRCEIGENYLDVCRRAKGDHAADAIAVVQGLEAVLAGTRNSFALEYVSHNGAERRWQRIMVTPVARGGKDGAVIMLLDVTDRKLAEEQLKINASALRHLTEAVIITDAELHVVAVNKAFVTITGFVAERMLGRRLADLVVDTDAQNLMKEIRTTIDSEGAWKGELRSRRADGELFPAYCSFSPVRNDAGHIEHYTAVFTDLTAFREFERRIEFLSQHDALTGLPNRNALAAQLQEAIPLAKATGTTFALLVAELDDFKTVNDTMGHATGDLLLKAVADRLRKINRAGDGLARMGGDEFGILVINLNHPAEAERVAERIRVALERPFRISGQDMFVTASIGVSSFSNDGQDFESLLRAADAAVYRAKQLGRNTVSWYSAEMDVANVERFTIQNSLPQALAQGQFILEYQPTINLFNGRVTGAEALIRWRHPQLGLVGPTRFIGLAEETGLIIPIGEWVFRTACHPVARWIASGWSDATVAVNLSARQFAQPELTNRITAALTEANIEPWRLRLEVTESMVMNDPDAAASTIERLSYMGVQMALDDFGTGYSSFNYLKRFHLRCLKVDRSFISGVASDNEDASIVRAIIALGKALGMKIVGEGIETLAQADFLRNAGCDDGQGFYYSPATSPADVRAMAMSDFPLATGSLQAQLDLIDNRTES